MSSRESPPLLEVLRTRTGALHTALEQTRCMARLVAPDLTRAELARALTVLAVGFSRVEEGLREETWYRPQAPAIAADLWRLPRAAAPEVVEGPALDSPAARAGAAYVLVGSRLGARTVVRHLRASVGEAFVAGSGYYGEEASHAGEQWSRLLERLAEVDDEEEAATAAAATFRMLIALSEAADRDE